MSTVDAASVLVRFLKEGAPARARGIMPWFAEKRRRPWKAADFSAAWSECVDRNVPYQRLLSAEDRAELRGDIQFSRDPGAR